MQRLELEHRGKLLGAPQFVPDHVSSNFCCERKRKSHKKARILPRDARGVNEPTRFYTLNRPPVIVWTCIRILAYRSPNSKINLRLRWICGVKLNNWESKPSKNQAYEKIILSSICRWTNWLRQPTRALARPRSDRQLSLFPVCLYGGRMGPS